MMKVKGYELFCCHIQLNFFFLSFLVHAFISSMPDDEFPLVRCRLFSLFFAFAFAFVFVEKRRKKKKEKREKRREEDQALCLGGSAITSVEGSVKRKEERERERMSSANARPTAVMLMFSSVLLNHSVFD